MRCTTKLLAAVLTVALICGGILAATGAAAPNAPSGDGSAAAPSPLSGSKVVTLAAAAPLFTDVPADADYAPAVAWCKERGLMDGTGGDAFSPDATLTRAMVATVLYRAAGELAVSGVPAFGDTKAGEWYSNAVVWASQNGIVGGYGNGSFGTNDPITQEQLDVMIRRYKGENPVWTANPALAVPATRAEAAVAFFANLNTTPSGETTSNAGGGPVVYMTTDISSDGLMAVYEALNASPDGKIAVKLSTGEPPASNYLRPDLIGALVQSLNATIVECNTAYGGSRSNTAMHYQVAKDHGYTDIAAVDIMDENGSMTLPITGGSNLTENYVGTNFANYDYFVVLSHFKGHSMAGYGGAIKNISIGIASSQGKSHIHTAGRGGSMWNAAQDPFLESMAEAGKSVVDALDGNILYINVMNRLSVDCDCDGNPSAPDMHDIGILASFDPVALDQACIDLVYSAADGQSLIRRIESRNGLHTLEHAEEIGLGSRSYELVSIDD